MTARFKTCVFLLQAARLHSSSAAFTLIEMLVVLVIVSIFASLSLAGILSARTSGRLAKTNSTIRKLSEIILPYYEQYETRRPSLPSVTTMSRPQIADLRRTAIRRLMAIELPERASDLSDAKRSLKDLSEVPPVTQRYLSIVAGQSADSARLLHMIVTRGPVADPDVISHFRADEITDRSGDGVADAFVDGWNNPIRFLRWPIGFVSPLQPIDARLSSRDEKVSHNGHRLVPLIYSAGPDGSYDIVADQQSGGFSYYGFAYDPFAAAASESLRQPPTAAGGEVGLWEVVRGLHPKQTTTYAALRADGSGAFDVPSLTPLVAEDAGVLGAGPFQTIGSERALETPGSLGSRDNIHNHNLAR